MPPPDYAPRFGAIELRRFLTAVDAHLQKNAAIILLGGSAVALYGVPVGTMDIDTYETDLTPLERAFEQARAVTGLNVPVSRAGVADAPLDYADRLQREPGEWTRLTVWKLEPHDLALSKALRANENDLAAIEGLHRIAPLDLETLVERYVTEMCHVIGEPSRLDTNFLVMIERLYGARDADRIEDRVRSRRSVLNR